MNSTLLIFLAIGAVAVVLVVAGERRRGGVWKVLNSPLAQTGFLGLIAAALAHRLGSPKRDALGDAYDNLLDAQELADKRGASQYLAEQARDPRLNPRLSRYQAPPAPADPPPNE